MSILKELGLLVRLSHSRHIARRYFVVNGFDGALAMLGLNMGFYVSGGVAMSTAVSACAGTAIALGMSGLSSAYVSEMAERRRELRELERAMVTDLGQSVHATAARLVPVLIALVNGLAPFLIAMLVTTPLWLEQAGIAMPFGAVRSAIATAFLVIFLMGILLGRISGTFWLWSALRTLAIAALTGALILLFAQ
jgi:predicted membrane protein (TIGR00267 family)